MASLAGEFTKGLWKEIPPFRLVLGLCPTLAVTKSFVNGLGMGLATVFVLVCSNTIVSLLRNVIPKKVRLACYIVIIATFVVIVELLMQAYVYNLYQALGIFIPLIVVNCIILGRAEAFASKNTTVRSALDGLGIGIGFTLSLGFLGAIREVVGKGTILEGSQFMVQVFGQSFKPFTFMVEAPGAFVCLGLMLGIMNILGE
ncbi:MAG: electron transport complex subunit E [Chrysiogenales bacterium]|nr:MAG: electron transport complex subunit E [Chrysiogenales bacterium]